MNLDAAMIAKARQIMDVWKLGLSAASTARPAQVFPTAWCDPTADNIGWQKLHIEQDDYHVQSQSNSGSGWWNNFQSHSSSSSGGGAIGFGFFVAGAEGGSASSDTLAASQNWSWSNGAFHNDASNLTIDLEYGLVTIDRPWLVSDLFYLQNWYLTGYKKNAISDGTINGQVGDKDKLLPMLPKQFLVIRNMKISAEDWGSDSHFLQSTYNSAKSQGHTSSGHVSGGGGFSLGFINVGGTASHGWSDSSASASGRAFPRPRATTAGSLTASRSKSEMRRSSPGSATSSPLARQATPPTCRTDVRPAPHGWSIKRIVHGSRPQRRHQLGAHHSVGPLPARRIDNRRRGLLGRHGLSRL